MSEEMSVLAPEITDSSAGGSDAGADANSVTDAGESTTSSPPPATATATTEDPISPPPPPDDPISSPPPPESTPTPDPSPPPPPPDSSPPPPPSPPPPKPSPPPPELSPPPPATTTTTPTASSPPPPVTDSEPPPITPATDSEPPPIDTETPSSQLPPPSPSSSSVPAGTTSNSPSPPLQAVTNDKPSSSSSSSSGKTPHSSQTGGGSTGKGSTTSSKDAASPPASTNNTGLIVALVLVFAIILALVIIGVICCCKRKKKKKTQMYSLAPGGGHLHGQPRPSNKNMPGDHIVKLPPPPGGGGGSSGISSGEYSFGVGSQNQGLPLSPNMGLGVNTCSFTYQDLSAATRGFSEANVIGQGGFGYVYKGVLPNGKEVAVKSLKAGSGQGDREFQAEVEIISRVHHRYLVSLVGYCIADGQRMLVYDFVPNNTLEYHLHGNGQPTMDWGTRLKIATGSAKGLAYLHEDCHPRIIHRDIKAANILIDYNFEAQVADFGLAKLTVDNNTHVSTRVMGTFGYLAPEYASSGKLSEKSDVFSFGVMLLELITGRKPLDHTGKIMEDSLVDWARPHLAKAQEDGNYNEIADPNLEGKYDHNEMARMVACASSSVRHSARRRPKMSQIVRALEGNLSFEALNDTKPGQGMGANGNDSSAYDTGEYNADMTKFRQMVMSGQDLNSSEFGDSSEY